MVMNSNQTTQKLSILYLRCITKVYVDVSAGVGYTFNSLFEMPRRPGVVPNAALLARIFQFSI